MAKLIFEYAEILDADGNSLGTPEYIKNIVVDSIDISLEADQVVVEGGRPVNESFTGGITIRTKDTNFSAVGGSGATTAILLSDYISSDGTTPFEGRLRLHGKAGSHDITTATTYIQGHEMYDNGRLETMIMAQAADVDSSVALASSTPA